MRSSDCSSDVCSSDLQPRLRRKDVGRDHRPAARPAHDERPRHLSSQQIRDPLVMTDASPSPIKMAPIKMAPRSEEHTSELQSLMRISYAVFCLKKKKNNHTSTRTPLMRRHTTQ